MSQLTTSRTGAVLLFGASFVLSACHATTPAGSAMTEAQVNREAQRYWDRYSGYRETEIREGGFKTLVIGMMPAQVVSVLTMLNVHAIIPLPAVRRATSAGELETLRDANAIRLGPGSAVFKFDGNDVIDSLVGYDLADNERGRSAVNRAEVFAWLATIVDATPHHVVTTFDPTAKPMRLPASPAEVERFSRFAIWETDFRDDDGYWHLRSGHPCAPYIFTH